MTTKDKIRRFLDKGVKATDIAKKLGVTPAHVYTTKHEIKKESESRKEVMKRTMKKPSKIIAAVKEMKTALDFLEKERADEAKAEKDWNDFGSNVTTRRFTKEEMTALDKDWVEFPKDHVVGADLVNHPPHYKTGGIETIDFIEAKDLNYRLGNVIKYVSRAEKKGNPLEDLRKAKWYLEREIAVRERA